MENVTFHPILKVKRPPFLAFREISRYPRRIFKVKWALQTNENMTFEPFFVFKC